MNFLNNKHIINYIRTTLNDLTDTSFSIEEKVNIVNNAIKMYSKYIYNYKTIELPTLDWITYLVPTWTNFIQSVRFTSDDKDEFQKEDYDYYIDEFQNIIFYDNTELKDIEVVLDKEYEELQVELVWNLTSWTDKIITINSDDLVVWDVVMIKDSTKEEITKIKSKDETSITVDLVNSYISAYLIWNSSVKDFDILSIYWNYYSSSKESNGSWQIKSKSWTQGWRSWSVSFATYNGKWETWNESLDLFINRLKADKNYKFKEFQGLKIFTNYK